jgi:hypothetical protein
MPKSLDRTNFLANPIRLAIAEFCSSEWRSADEIAERLGRPSGSLSQPKTMAERKVLKTKTRPATGGGGRKAKVYRLNPSWRPDLEAARARRRPEGPANGQDLLLIPLSDTPEACALLADGVEEIAWAAQLAGESVGLMVAPAADPSGAATMRVLKALGPVGRQARRLRVMEVMSAGQLREWSRSVIAGESRELPPGA